MTQCLPPINICLPPVSPAPACGYGNEPLCRVEPAATSSDSAPKPSRGLANFVRDKNNSSGLLLGIVTDPSGFGGASAVARAVAPALVRAGTKWGQVALIKGGEVMATGAGKGVAAKLVAGALAALGVGSFAVSTPVDPPKVFVIPMENNAENIDPRLRDLKKIPESRSDDIKIYLDHQTGRALNEAELQLKKDKENYARGLQTPSPLTGGALRASAEDPSEQPPGLAEQLEAPLDYPETPVSPVARWPVLFSPLAKAEMDFNRGMRLTANLLSGLVKPGRPGALRGLVYSAVRGNKFSQRVLGNAYHSGNPQQVMEIAFQLWKMSLEEQGISREQIGAVVDMIEKGDDLELLSRHAVIELLKQAGEMPGRYTEWETVLIHPVNLDSLAFKMPAPKEGELYLHFPGQVSKLALRSTAKGGMFVLAWGEALVMIFYYPAFGMFDHLPGTLTSRTLRGPVKLNDVVFSPPAADRPILPPSILTLDGQTIVIEREGNVEEQLPKLDSPRGGPLEID